MTQLSTPTSTATGKPPVVDAQTWRAELDELRKREKAATRELDAIAAQRRRLPMVELPDYTLIGADGPVRLADVFKGRSQLITYHHMWSDGAEWQCGGCTGFTSQFTRLEFLNSYDARFVIVTNGPIEEALAYRDKVGNKMDWYSSAESPFGADVDAPPNAGFGVNVFLRDPATDTVYRTWHTNGRGTEQLSHSFALIDLLPWGRQEEWQDSPEGWPKSPTYSNWLDSPDIARVYGLRSTSMDRGPTRRHPHHRRNAGRDSSPCWPTRRATKTPNPETGSATRWTPSPSPASDRSSPMNMFLEFAGGHYVMHNLVTEFEKDRSIAWLPGQLDDAGNHGSGRLVVALRPGSQR